MRAVSAELSRKDLRLSLYDKQCDERTLVLWIFSVISKRSDPYTLQALRNRPQNSPSSTDGHNHSRNRRRTDWQGSLWRRRHVRASADESQAHHHLVADVWRDFSRCRRHPRLVRSQRHADYDVASQHHAFACVLADLGASACVTHTRVCAMAKMGSAVTRRAHRNLRRWNREPYFPRSRHRLRHDGLVSAEMVAARLGSHFHYRFHAERDFAHPANPRLDLREARRAPTARTLVLDHFCRRHDGRRGDFANCRRADFGTIRVRDDRSSRSGFSPAIAATFWTQSQVLRVESCRLGAHDPLYWRSPFRA